MTGTEGESSTSKYLAIDARPFLKALSRLSLKDCKIAIVYIQQPQTLKCLVFPEAELESVVKSLGISGYTHYETTKTDLDRVELLTFKPGIFALIGNNYSPDDAHAIRSVVGQFMSRGRNIFVYNDGNDCSVADDVDGLAVHLFVASEPGLQLISSVRATLFSAAGYTINL